MTLKRVKSRDEGSGKRQADCERIGVGMNHESYQDTCSILVTVVFPPVSEIPIVIYELAFLHSANAESHIDQEQSANQRYDPQERGQVDRCHER